MLEVRQCGTGKGVFAAADFNIGDCVLAIEGRPADKRGSHTIQVGRLEHMLPDPPGLYLNHSCDPNCGIQGTRILVARRRIAQGEQVTFDYAMTEEELEYPFDCQCGAESCRGQITGFRDLPPEIIEEYGTYISDYLIGS